MQKIGKMAVICAGGLWAFWCIVAMAANVLGKIQSVEMGTLTEMMQAGTVLSLAVLVGAWVASLARRTWKFVVSIFEKAQKKYGEVLND